MTTDKFLANTLALAHTPPVSLAKGSRILSPQDAPIAALPQDCEVSHG